ncbi:holocytochrome c synthase [Vanrija albida]|uniref:Holocytochrome c-type synthase n=1 Tax=Vanrija albida TaxID=181172 RepID=A0ABR3PYX9_9TREE
MKWFIGGSEPAESSSLPADHPPVPSGGAAQCPVDHKALAAERAAKAAAAAAAADAPAKCPVDHKALAAEKEKAKGGAACPVDHTGAALSPYNHMPVSLSATERAPGQVLDLDTSKTLSSIPRPKTDDSDSAVWEYPSPQQFYNALVRKGQGAPEESIDMVVDIHNWINEGAWAEVMKWEKRLPGGDKAMLAKFQGKPGTLSPKARLNLFLGRIFPSKFNTEVPFDRHDWIVTRPVLDADGKPTAQEAEQRYVIDYYSAGQDEEGFPQFSLDVRPAVDSFGAVSERVRVAVEEWMAGDAAPAPASEPRD